MIASIVCSDSNGVGQVEGFDALCEKLANETFDRASTIVVVTRFTATGPFQVTKRKRKRVLSELAARGCIGVLTDLHDRPSVDCVTVMLITLSRGWVVHLTVIDVAPHKVGVA